MNKVLLLTAALLVVTSASAETTTTAGNSGTVGTAGCVFSSNTAGAMTRANVTGNAGLSATWRITTPARVTVTSRDRSNIRVTSDNKLLKNNGDETGLLAVVNYRGTGTGVVASTYTTTATGTTSSILETSMALTGNTKAGATVTTVAMGGTAMMTRGQGAGRFDAALDFIDNNTVYKIAHVVTCSQ